jgi:hypothetical protein
MNTAKQEMEYKPYLTNIKPAIFSQRKEIDLIDVIFTTPLCQKESYLHFFL